MAKRKEFAEHFFLQDFREFKTDEELRDLMSLLSHHVDVDEAYFELQPPTRKLLGRKDRNEAAAAVLPEPIDVEADDLDALWDQTFDNSDDFLDEETAEDLERLESLEEDEAYSSDEEGQVVHTPANKSVKYDRFKQSRPKVLVFAAVTCGGVKTA